MDRREESGRGVPRGAHLEQDPRSRTRFAISLILQSGRRSLEWDRRTQECARHNYFWFQASACTDGVARPRSLAR